MKAWWDSLGRTGHIIFPISVVIGLLIFVGAVSPSSKKTTGPTKTTATASLSCGSGTHEAGSECAADAARARIVVHTRTVTRTVTVTTPAPAPAAAPSSAPSPPVDTEDVGSLSHAGDAEFCSTHSCIASFSSGAGAVVQCADGEYGHSGGIQGACSDHGGEE